MRDILYRGMTTKGEMIFGSLVVANAFIPHMPNQHTKTWIVTSAFGNGGWFNIRGRKYVKPETVGQFTGLKDKNGVDIYSGDVTPYLDCSQYGKVNAVVFWHEASAGFMVKWMEGDSEAIDSIEGCEGWLEVIGNIHQNKELIENVS